MNRLSFPITLILFFTISINAQQNIYKGVPHITQFTPVEYGDYGKVWDIKEADNGLIYFACRDGLLEFDGYSWKIFSGSKGITRSLLVKDSLIFSGSDQDFGYWSISKETEWQYKSLYPYNDKVISKSEEFWDIYDLDDFIVFISKYNIYVYDGNYITKIPSPEPIIGCAKQGHEIFLTTKSKLLSFNGMSLSERCNLSAPIDLTGVVSFKQKDVFISKSKGIWILSQNNLIPFKSSLSKVINGAQVLSVQELNKGSLAIGTIKEGLLVLDSTAAVIHQINRAKGLLNQTILSTYHSSHGFLWIGMDYGIAKVDLNNKNGYIYDHLGNFGNPEEGIVYQDEFFLGTNQGLYKTDWSDLNNSIPFFDFQFISGSHGQVWSLEVLGGQLMCGHDKGLFVFQNKKFKQIDSRAGVWCILPLEHDILFTGNYEGIHIYKFSNGNWEYWKSLEGVIGSCVDLVKTKQNILWAKIPNFGLVRILLDDQLDVLERQNFIFDSLKIEQPDLVKKDSTLYILQGNEAYIFNEKSNSFEPVENMAGIDTRRYRELSQGYLFTELENGFELYPLRDRQENVTSTLNILIRGIESLDLNRSLKSDLLETRKIKARNIHLNTVIPQHSEAIFRYKLLRDSMWSAWQNSGQIYLFDLSPGINILQIEAKTRDGQTVTETIEFEVLPYWYISKWALGIYSLFAAIAIYLFFIWQKARDRKKALAYETSFKKKHQQNRWQIEKDELLSQVSSLQHQLHELEQKVKDKSVELAKKAKESDDKNKILEQIKEKLVQWKSAKGTTKEVSEMLRLIDNFIQLDDKTFEIQIDELQQEFYKSLKDAYPDLSTYDLRLCAYVKLGLSSKEIAQIQGVLPSSVNVSRSRLRKKLNLDTGDDLFDTLNQF